MKKLYILFFVLAFTVANNQSSAQIINGSVTDSLGTNINAGTVELIELQYDTMGTLFPTGNSTTVAINNGAYSFSGAQPGNYWILANPDAIQYPTALSTYYGNTASWSAAMALYYDTGATANIVVIKLAPLMGTGTFSGIIQYGIGTGKTGDGNPHPTGDPVPGIDVALEQIPGGIKAYATTDQSGVYTITNIPLNTTYKLLVDIPGLPMDSSYTVSLTGSNTSAGGLDFVVDTAADGTAGIYIGWPVSTKELQILDLGISIYPNPTSGKTTVAVAEGSSISSFEIYNVLGEQVYNSFLESFTPSLINISNQPEGIYFISIQAGEKKYYQKLIKR